MIRTLLMWACLRRLRRIAPEMFRGDLAAEAIRLCLEEDGYPSVGNTI